MSIIKNFILESHHKLLNDPKFRIFGNKKSLKTTLRYSLAPSPISRQKVDMFLFRNIVDSYKIKNPF